MCYNVVKRNTFEVKIMTTTVSLRLPEDLKNKQLMFLTNMVLIGHQQ